MTSWIPLRLLSLNNGSWQQHRHAPDCAFAFLYDAPIPPPNATPTDDLYQHVVTHVRACGISGCTADEVSTVLGCYYPALLKHQTASARVSEALRDDVLIPTGLSRKTRSNRWAQVLVDAQLKPRWRCAPGCKADYRGLWRIAPDGQEVRGWSPRPLCVALTHRQWGALAVLANRGSIEAYVLQTLGLDRIGPDSERW